MNSLPRPLPQILVVDDDEEITALLCDYLSSYGMRAHAADGAEAMRRQMTAQPIDLVVMDLMLPGTDGLALTRELRQESYVPVIMLTARGDLYDRVIGLEWGADDYMSKPFAPRELVARIQTVLRRVRHGQGADEGGLLTEVIRFDGWSLHRMTRRLTSPQGLAVPLSGAEFQLLTAFLQAPRRLLSRDQLMELSRGRSLEAFERSIDLLVSRLRQKLGDDSREPVMLKTVRGAGYLFNAQSIR